MFPEFVWVIVCWILIGIGLIGAIVPIIPSTVLILAAGILHRVFVSEHPGWAGLSALAVLFVAAFGVDYLATALGAKKFGASGLAIIFGIFGGVIGIFFGLVGVLFFPLIGAVLGEVAARKSMPQALRVGYGTLIGTLVGMIGKFGIALLMGITFYTSTVFGF
ncbi:MAG: DUF456 domain-containing protein [Verrucomicrobiales bacterium]